MSTTLEYNAVFKGGGAKGIAYAGALQACEEQGIEFPEVAGSSAGAITATLVACGYNAEEIVQEMPSALASIGGVPESLAMVGLRPSLLGNEGLLLWISDAISRKILTPDGKPSAGDLVTFAEVEAATGKKLYVVTLDLATRQPRVFSPDLTPDSPVAAAVVASSAIPVAFPSARVQVNSSIHRLVDGGTWANYPTFVFHDKDFRRCHDLGDNNRQTLGFILDQEEAPEVPQESPQPRSGGRLLIDRGSSTDQMGIPGAIISSTGFRWLAALVPLMFVLLSVLWIRDEMRRADPWIGRLPESVHEFVLVIVVAIFAITGILALLMSFAIIRLGRTLFDSGIVGAMAALGVGPSVPYWVGRSNDEHTAVRIAVPDDLSTLNFKPDAATRALAHERGYRATRRALLNAGHTVPPAAPQLDGESVDANLGRPRGLRLLVWPCVLLFGFVFRVVARVGGLIASVLRTQGWARAVATVYVIVGGTFAVFEAMRNFAVDREFVAVFWLTMVGTAVALGAWLVANDRYTEASSPRPYPLLGQVSTGRLRLIGWVSLAVAGLLTAVLLTSPGTSILTASRAEPVLGFLVDVTPARGDDVVVDVLVDDDVLSATLDNLDDEAFFDVSDRFLSDGLVDLDNRPVPFCEDTDLATCFRITTSDAPGVAIGEEMALRVDLEGGRIFAEDDVFDRDRGQASVGGMFLFTLLFLAVGTRSLRAANWKLQQEDMIDSVALPAHAPSTDTPLASPVDLPIQSDAPAGNGFAPPDPSTRVSEHN